MSQYAIEGVQTYGEEALFYSIKGQDALAGCIGHLQMDYGKSGDEFNTVWTDHANKEMNTPYFSEKLEMFIDVLRGTLFGSRAELKDYCQNHEEYMRINEFGEKTWCFRVLDEKYAYYLRCVPKFGGSDIYCYAYHKDTLMNYLAGKRGLPEHCYSELPDTHEPILIRYAEKGYYPITLPEGVTVDSLNRMNGVTNHQRLAMEAGSMFGWKVPGADPKVYDKGDEKPMKIKIYQVSIERDKNNVAFQSHDTLERWQGTDAIDSGIYDKVFEGEVKADSLEDVYRIFNVDRPSDFKGRSLSISDIVEVEESPEVEKGFYFCDSVGFTKVDFDPEPPAVGKSNLIRALVVEPEKKPYVKMIDPGLESLQHEVDGYIEVVYPYDEPVGLVVNEEGKLSGLPLNRALRDENGEIYDAVAGKFLVVGLGEEDFCSLDNENLKKFSDKFALPEMFIHMNGKLTVVPVLEEFKKEKEKTGDGER